ncbi:MAG: amino acid ABC transporter permease [Burkholderiaceae bacterium]|nr:amino acid ABC transporter permease [Burkholderiaceae bacterium]
MNHQWNWGLLLQTSEIYGETYWWLFLISIGWTLCLSLVSGVIALFLGTFVGVMRTLHGRIPRLFSLVYVQVFRGVPLIVQLFLWYFILPELWGPLKSWVVSTNTLVVQFLAASVCLGLFTSARITEQVRSGIQSLSAGAMAAAQALGLTPIQAYRHVVLPQAFRIILPPLTSEMMNLIKNSSIAMTIGFAELTFRAREVGETTFAYFEAFLVATFAYIVIAYSANRFSAWYASRMKITGLVVR